VIIKSINPLSAGKMLGLTYACLGLLIGGIVSLVALAGAAGKQGGAAGLLFGAGAVILIPLFYGVLGFIGGLISALIYNVIAGAVGGIEIEVEESGGRSYRSRARESESDEW
jgi:hypothetical protein